jgi:hypothetical protein
MTNELPEVICYCVPERQLETLNVYRYTRQAYIDLFFQTGKIRLNSLKVYQAECKPAEEINEEIYDKNEGKAMIAQGKNNKNGFIYTDFSQGVLNLSTSFKRSKDILENFQQAEGGEHKYGVFEITNPVGFSNIVGQKIHEKLPLQHIMIGKCDYVDQSKKVVDYEKLKTSISRFRNGLRDESIQAHTFSTIDVEQIIDVFFLKNKQHEHQTEFRFLWKGEALVGKTYLDVEVPEALQYCRQIDF